MSIPMKKKRLSKMRKHWKLWWPPFIFNSLSFNFNPVPFKNIPLLQVIFKNQKGSLRKKDCRRSLKTLAPIYSCKQSLKSCLRALRLTSLYVKNLGLFKFCWKVCSIKVEKKKVNTTIISEYAWICLNKQCQRSKYVRFLNMRALHNILNMPQYALTKFWIPKICKDS